eukprot:1855680-Amphidinium_carterae.1
MYWKSWKGAGCALVQTAAAAAAAAAGGRESGSSIGAVECWLPPTPTQAIRAGLGFGVLDIVNRSNRRAIPSPIA